MKRTFYVVELQTARLVGGNAGYVGVVPARALWLARSVAMCTAGGYKIDGPGVSD